MARSLTPATPARTLEALKLLNDWCKWLVGVQTAAIAALGFLARATDVAALQTTFGSLAVAAGTASIACFVGSMALASYLLLFIPSMVEQLSETYGSQHAPQPLSYTKVPFRPGWQVGTFTAWQSRLFVVGIALFALSFVFLFYSR
jgi:hypothetical protein